MAEFDISCIPYGRHRLCLILCCSDPELCPSYPSHVIVPTCTGDLDYIRGAKQYHEGRFPTLTWYDRHSGVALFRAAGTVDGRGQFSSNMQADEALLQSIAGSKLDPKGPATQVHVYADRPESGYVGVCELC